MAHMSISTFLLLSSQLIHCLISVDVIEAVNKDFFQKEEYKEFEQTIFNPVLGHIYKCVTSLPSVSIYKDKTELSDSDVFKSFQTSKISYNIMIAMHDSTSGIKVFTENNSLRFNPKGKDSNNERLEFISAFCDNLVDRIAGLLKLSDEEKLSKASITFSNKDSIKLVYHKILSIHGLILNFCQTVPEYQYYLSSIFERAKIRKILVGNLDKLDLENSLFNSMYSIIPKLADELRTQENAAVFKSNIILCGFTKKQKFAVLVLKIISCSLYNSKNGVICLEKLQLKPDDPLYGFFEEFALRNLKLTKELCKKWFRIFNIKTGFNPDYYALNYEAFIPQNSLFKLISSIQKICGDKITAEYETLLKSQKKDGPTSVVENFETLLKCICGDNVTPSAKLCNKGGVSSIDDRYPEWSLELTFEDKIMIWDLKFEQNLSQPTIEISSKDKSEFLKALSEKLASKSANNMLHKILSRCLDIYYRRGYKFSKFTYVSIYADTLPQVCQSMGLDTRTKCELNILSTSLMLNSDKFIHLSVEKIYQESIKPHLNPYSCYIFDPLFEVNSFSFLKEEDILKIFYELIEDNDLKTLYQSILDLFYLKLESSSIIIKELYFGIFCSDENILKMIKASSNGLEHITFQGALNCNGFFARNWNEISKKFPQTDSIKGISLLGSFPNNIQYNTLKCLLDVIGYKISVLRIRELVLTDQDLSKLVEVLSFKDNNITELDIFGGAILGENVYVIVQALKPSISKLTKLTINDAKIGSNSVIKKLDDVKCSNLASLSLLSTKIDFLIINTIANFLKDRNSKLEFLNLSHNDLEFQKAQILASALSFDQNTVATLDLTFKTMEFQMVDGLESNYSILDQLYVRRSKGENAHNSCANSLIDSIKLSSDDDYIFMAANHRFIDILRNLNKAVLDFFLVSHKNLDSTNEVGRNKTFFADNKYLLPRKNMPNIFKENFTLSPSKLSKMEVIKMLKQRKENENVRICLFYTPNKE